MGDLAHSRAMDPVSPALLASLTETYDGLDDAVSVIDRTLRLVYVNDAFCALVGWPRPVLLGAEPPMPWWTAEESERAAGLLRKLMDGGEISGPSEERVYKHRTGREIPVSIRSSLLRDEAGTVAALVAITRSLEAPSQEQAPVDALRAEREQLARAEQAQRVAAQTTVAIVQELETPLGVIRDRAAGLAEALAGTDHAAAIQAIAGAAERIEQTSRDLLAVVDAPSPEVPVTRAPVDLVPVTLAALADLGHEADRRGVRLRGDVGPGAVVQGDATRLRQALDSLAAKAMRRAPQGTEVFIGLKCGGGWAILDVEDRGEDLDEAAREALFTTLPPGGTGVGLSIARSVARAHGGELDAVAQPEGGLLLRMTLPLAEDGPA